MICKITLLMPAPRVLHYYADQTLRFIQTEACLPLRAEQISCRAAEKLCRVSILLRPVENAK